MRQIVAVLSFLLIADRSSQAKSPNIVIFLTDDLDSELHGLVPLRKTRMWLPTRFSNAFVSTPICCPSRASLLTGKYQHNTQVFNNSISGNCDSLQWRNGLEKHTFAALLKDDYTTFYGGKYLNQYGTKRDGVKHVPLGWNFWVTLHVHPRERFIKKLGDTSQPANVPNN